MIIDFHTHIFPEEICLNRENYFHGEPAFKLLYDSPKSKLVKVEELISVMDDQQVDMSVVFGFPWNSGKLAKLNNDYIIEAVSKFPDRLRGLACFDMNWQGAAHETERCINAGLSGVGELAFYLSGIDENAVALLKPVMEICRESGNLPISIHTNESVGHKYPGKTPVTMAQIYDLAIAFPENRIVLAHLGGGILFYNLLRKEAKTVLKNIWYDTAAAPFLYDPALYRAVKHIGVMDKILFGTDFPLLKPSRYYKDLNASGISEEDKKKILGGNAGNLLAGI